MVKGQDTDMGRDDLLRATWNGASGCPTEPELCGREPLVPRHFDEKLLRCGWRAPNDGSTPVSTRRWRLRRNCGIASEQHQARVVRESALLEGKVGVHGCTSREKSVAGAAAAQMRGLAETLTRMAKTIHQAVVVREP
jgi:hypothetical protein